MPKRVLFCPKYWLKIIFSWMSKIIFSELKFLRWAKYMRPRPIIMWGENFRLHCFKYRKRSKWWLNLAFFLFLNFIDRNLNFLGFLQMSMFNETWKLTGRVKKFNFHYIKNEKKVQIMTELDIFQFQSKGNLCKCNFLAFLLLTKFNET